MYNSVIAIYLWHAVLLVIALILISLSSKQVVLGGTCGSQTPTCQDLNTLLNMCHVLASPLSSCPLPTVVRPQRLTRCGAQQVSAPMPEALGEL